MRCTLTFGEKLYIYLKRSNITNTELANRLHISRNNLQNMLKRDNFTEKQMKDICNILEIDLSINIKYNNETL